MKISLNSQFPTFSIFRDISSKHFCKLKFSETFVADKFVIESSRDIWV